MPGQVQGARAQQEDAIQQVGQAAQSMAPPLPDVIPMGTPSQRPHEPITSGLSTGPGPGPEILGPGRNSVDPDVAFLRGVYEAFPNEDIRRLIEFAQRRQTGRGEA